MHSGNVNELNRQTSAHNHVWYVRTTSVLYACGGIKRDSYLNSARCLYRDSDYCVLYSVQ